MTLFFKDRMHANNLACWPSIMSWSMFRHKYRRYIKGVLTNKKESTSSHYLGQSFFFDVYYRVIVATLPMEGNNWSCIVKGGPLLGSVSLLFIKLSVIWHICFPSTGSGIGLDLIMVSSIACSAAERKIVAPSLWSRQGWELEIG